MYQCTPSVQRVQCSTTDDHRRRGRPKHSAHSVAIITIYNGQGARGGHAPARQVRPGSISSAKAFPICPTGETETIAFPPSYRPYRAKAQKGSWLWPPRNPLAMLAPAVKITNCPWRGLPTYARERKNDAHVQRCTALRHAAPATPPTSTIDEVSRPRAREGAGQQGNARTDAASAARRAPGGQRAAAGSSRRCSTAHHRRSRPTKMSTDRIRQQIPTEFD